MKSVLRNEERKTLRVFIKQERSERVFCCLSFGNSAENVSGDESEVQFRGYLKWVHFTS